MAELMATREIYLQRKAKQHWAGTTSEICQKLPQTREGYKEKLEQILPDRKKRYYPVAAGQLFRFVHEMKIGDIIIYPSKADRLVYIGEVTGEYEHIKDGEGYSQRRAVKWGKTTPRTRFSQGALYEIGSALSFFQVKTYADEFLAALDGTIETQPPRKDETVGYVAEEINDLKNPKIRVYAYYNPKNLEASQQKIRYYEKHRQHIIPSLERAETTAE